MWFSSFSWNGECLKITQYHNLPKNALIEAIVERQNELDLLQGIKVYKHDVPRRNNETVEMNKISDTGIVNTFQYVNSMQTTVSLVIKKPQDAGITEPRAWWMW